IEEQSINWSINFLVRVVQGAVTSMLLVWLFRFDSILKRARQRSVQPCCLYDLCALATLAIVLPILLYFCSDFYHQVPCPPLAPFSCARLRPLRSRASRFLTVNRPRPHSAT